MRKNDRQSKTTLKEHVSFGYAPKMRRSGALTGPGFTTLRYWQIRNEKAASITSMSDYTFSIHTPREQHGIEVIRRGMTAIYTGLGKNITENTGMSELGRELSIFIHDNDDEIVGGLSGTMFGGWLYVSLLWIEKSIRGNGYGTRLMRIAEKEAAKAGCRHVHLDTYSFEARPFYERLGYELFATLDDYPPGYCKYFLKKQLVPRLR